MESLADAQRIVVLTGAGISTSAGIPDFRGPEGLWTRDPYAELVSTLSWYLNDEDVRFLDGLATPLKEGDVVTVLPAVAGGAR